MYALNKKNKKGKKHQFLQIDPRVIYFFIFLNKILLLVFDHPTTIEIASFYR